MSSTALRAARLPISVVVSALVVAALLLLPANVSGFGLSVSVEGAGAGSDEFARGNVVPFKVTITVEDGEILAGTSTATVDLVITGPEGFERTITGIPLGGFLPEGATSAADQTTSFGPSTSTFDVAVSVSTPVADTTISGNVIHEQILTEFDQPFVGYGFGFKGLVQNASITIDGTLTLPNNVPTGTYTLAITVDNDPSEGAAQTVTVELTILPSVVTTLTTGWSAFSIPVRAKGLGGRVFATANIGTAAQNGLLDPANVDQAFRFDDTTQAFKEIVFTVTDAATQVSNDTPLLPTEAVVVFSNANHDVTLIYEDGPTGPPSRPVSAAWNLVSLALPPASTTMDATNALISLANAPGGDGYLIVVSPPFDPDPFILFRPLPAQDLTTFRGYWVFMDNADIIAGFSSTPVE